MTGKDNTPDIPYMTTLSECLKVAAERGFSIEFKMTDLGLVSESSSKLYTPSEIKILNFYRFEGSSDPEDSAIAYIIETNTGEKGTLVDAFGIYSDSRIDEFVKQIKGIEKDTTDKGAD